MPFLLLFMFPMVVVTTSEVQVRNHYPHLNLSDNQLNRLDELVTEVVSLQYSKESASHNLFVKEQRLKGESSQKALFVANIPPYVGEDVLKSTYGNQINSIQVIPSHKEGIGFKNASMVCKKYSKVFNSPLFSCELPHTGIQQWQDNYNRSKVDIKVLEEEINKYALHYKQQEEKKTKNSESKDEEGWTVVKKKGSKSSDLQRKATKSKVKKKDTKNFYVFQVRENNLKKLTDLRTSYEEAKKRVNLIKSSRKFKPY